MHRFVAMTASLVVLSLLPAAVANAGTVSRTSNAITYQADPAAGAREEVSLGLKAGQMFVTSSRGATSSDCPGGDGTRVDCSPAAGFVVNLLGFDATAFTIPANANAAIRLRLPTTGLRALKRVRSLRFTVLVTVGAKPFTSKLRLRAPKKR
jgi:uncharacterized membrane protein